MSTSKSLFVDLISANASYGASFDTKGMQLYEGMSIQFIKAMPRLENPGLFYKALYLRDSVVCKLDKSAEVTEYHPHDSIITTGQVSIRLTLKGNSIFEKVAEIDPEADFPEDNSGVVSRLYADFQPVEEHTDLFDIATPLAIDRNNTLKCQIVFPCNMEIKTYGGDELLTSDR